MSEVVRGWSDELEAALQQAVLALPGIAVELESARVFLATKLDSSSAGAELHVEDLVLVSACLGGDAVALEMFVAAYGDDIDVAARKGASAGVDPEELRATMMEQLFVDPRKAAQYSGRSELRRWLRVVVSRWVVDRIRRAAVRPAMKATDPAVLADAMQTRDPELRYLGEKYREPVRASLEVAFGKLTARERNLMRLRLLEGWGHDKLAARYGVHRTSAARWVGEAQRSLLQHARATMRDAYGIASGEFDTIARAVQSQLHLSLHRILDSELEQE